MRWDIIRLAVLAHLVCAVAGCQADDKDPGRAITDPKDGASADGVELDASAGAERDAPLDGPEDLAQPPAELWVSVDLHTHTHGCDSNEYTTLDVLERMKSAGIQVASVLLWGSSWSQNLPFFTGADDHVSTASHIVHYDAEISGFQAATGGHLLLLGLAPEASSELWADPYAYFGGSGVPILETGFGRLAALRGMAHAWTWPTDGGFPAPPLGCCMALELPVHVARGTLDFLATEYDFEADPVYGPLTVWERLLQAGFELPLVAASDWSCLRGRVGEMRSWVMISGALSYANVLASVKAGRVVAVSDESGRWLDMRVGAARLGDTIDVAADRPVGVEVQVDQPEGGVLRLTANGQVVHEQTLPAGRSTITVPLTFTRSSWITARIPKATTSPIYVTVAGAPIRPSAEAGCYFARYIDHLSALVGNGEVDLGVDRDAALEAYAEARAVFMTRFAEAGGGQCP